MEVLRKLLVEGGTEESVAQAVLGLVAKLVARNGEFGAAAGEGGVADRGRTRASPPRSCCCCWTS